MLAGRGNCRERFSQRCETASGELRIVAEIFHEQALVNASIQVENARAKAELAHEASACIFRGRLEIIDRCIKIILDCDLVGRDGMSDLYGCLPIEIGIVSEHAAEHGDVDGSIETSQHLIGLNVACFAFEHALGQRDGSFTFFGPDEGELRCPRNGRLALGPAGITLRLIDLGNFAENSGDCARDLARAVRLCAFLLNEIGLNLFTEALRTLTQMARKRLLEHVARTYGAFDCL